MKLQGIGMAAAFKVDPTPPSIETIAAELAGATFHPRPHLDALAALLEGAVRDVENGIPRAISVSMPPGLGKSQTASVALPLHILATHADWNIGIVTSEQSLAAKFSRDARRAAPSFGIAISRESAGQLEWETAKGGGIIARGVGGALTGRRLNVLIQDDLYRDARVAYSETERQNIWDWYQSVGKTRLAPASLALNVQTRWHEDDQAARLIAQGWEEFRLPALAETGDILGREVGEPLLTPQADETRDEALARWTKDREDVGEYVWAGLYQQRPAPAGGSIFNADDLRHIDEYGEHIPYDEGHWLTSWDLGFGTTDRERKASTDYTVGTVWQMTRGIHILHDMVRERLEFTGQLAAMRRIVNKYPQATWHLIEAAANGAAAIDLMSKDEPGNPAIPGITPVPARGSKILRWSAATPTLAAGRVFHDLSGQQLEPLRSEMVVAPNGKHDDTLDSVTHALNWWKLRQYEPPKVATRHVSRRLPGR